MLSPPKWRRVASWVCGWAYVVGNITITLAVNFGTTLFFVACINVFESEPGVGVFAGEPYQVFLIFLGITILCNAVSALGNKWLPWLDVRCPNLRPLDLIVSKLIARLQDRCHLLDLCRCHRHHDHDPRPRQERPPRRQVRLRPLRGQLWLARWLVVLRRSSARRLCHLVDWHDYLVSNPSIACRAEENK